MTRRILIVPLLIGLIVGYLAGCRSHVPARTVTHERNGTKMTLNEMRHIYPAYAAKERLLREQAVWAERLAQAEKISLEEARQRGIINDDRSTNASDK